MERKKSRTYINRTSNNIPKQAIWYLPRSSASGDKLRDGHPATFPEALARDHIISWSNPGDIVLDPMCGSGTTLKMAVEQCREYIGIDISQEYVSLAEKRVRCARIPLPGLGNTAHNNQNPGELLSPEQLEFREPE